MARSLSALKTAAFASCRLTEHRAIQIDEYADAQFRTENRFPLFLELLDCLSQFQAENRFPLFLEAALTGAAPHTCLCPFPLLADGKANIATCHLGKLLQASFRTV